MPKILIVDDDPQVLKMLARFFMAAEFIVATASDGLEGVETFKDFGPDLVLADVGMPNLDGPGMCAILRKELHARDVPFLFLSGEGQIGKVESALGEGADGYILKPFDLKRLMEKVEKMLERKRPET